MGWRAADKLIIWLIVGLAAATFYDGYHLLRASQLNRALVQVEAGDDEDADHPLLRFARAYALQQNGEFEAALEAYAAIDAPDGHRMRADIQYNLANLYLRRALQYRDNDAADLALPFVELAKEYYRELLREDSQSWPAKYNLELALRIAPETEPEEVEEEHNPEHNPRSAAGIQARKPLP
ncbi:MAG: MxaK protein [Woeseiaceae bacterium]